jgi:hypothetical protein
VTDFTPRTAAPRSDLAKARVMAHAAFDDLWKYGLMTRNAAYQWLADELGLTRQQCHMKNFDEAMCKRVVDKCNARSFAALFDKEPDYA